MSTHDLTIPERNHTALNRTARWRLWVLLSILAICTVALTKPTSYWQGEIVPVGNDSMYHARRIVDTASNPADFYEFDQKIHAPEGSLLTWPWGYDFAMAMMARAGVAVGLSDNPLEVAAWIPVASVILPIGLLLLICSELGLSRWASVLAGLCMALSPTTQILHGVGQLDHHFAESIMILAALAAGLRWLRNTDSIVGSIVFGGVLGIAPVIHNGLFILQLPILLVSASFWLQGQKISRRGTRSVAFTLLIVTLAILLPSAPFRAGHFEYFTLSWFHAYIAGCTGLTLNFISHTVFSRKTLTVGLTIAIALLLPLTTQVHQGGEFLVGSLGILSVIGEMQPPFKLAMAGEHVALNRIYSLLIWIAPLAWLVSIAFCWFDRTKRRLLFWITSTIGLMLLSMQLRLHYFGGFAMYLPWLVLLDGFANRNPVYRTRIMLGTTLALVLMYAPPLRYQIAAPAPIGNEMSLVPLRPLYAKLHDACVDDPGIVLADNNMGHYIRYYSDCAVIANNFLLTPQHFRKIEDIHRYLSMSASELLANAPQVKYVIVRPAEVGAKDGQIRYRFYFQGNSRLANDLLFDAPDRVPPEFKLLEEIRFKEAGNVPYAKLYKIERAAPSGNNANK